MSRGRLRFLLIVIALLFSAGIAYAVFYPSIGIRQNLAEEEFQKAWLLFQDRKFDAAIEKLSQALLINPEFHWARRFLAQAYYFSGQTAEALEEYETLVRAMPHDLTLKNRIAALTSSGITAGQANEFLRVIPRTQGYRYNRPTFIGSLASDRMAVLSLGNFEVGNMVSYSAQGEPYENRHRVSGKLNYPMAFAQNDDEIWITDFKEDKIHRLAKNPRRYLSYLFNPDALGKTGSADLEFRAPAGICHRAGEFIIADSGNNRLQRISDSGRFIASITRPAELSAFESPFGLYCDENAIWVTEAGAGRISHLDRYGNIVAEHAPAEMKKPRHITYDAAEQVFLVADESAGIIFMDPSGAVKRKTTGYAGSDGRMTAFARPYAAAFDAFRNFYVADYGASEIVQFVPPGEKFAQLYLQVEKISAARFPTLGVYVTVSTLGRDKSGIPDYLTGLTGEDFKIFENDATVGNLGVEYLKQFDDIFTGIILMPRSQKLKEAEAQLPWVLDHLLTRVREKDRYKVLTHGADIRRETDFTASRLKILKAVKDGLADDLIQPAALGTSSAALYDAVTELLTREGKRAVLYITDGGFDDETLAPYDKERLIGYARANHIAIHVVNFEHTGSEAESRAMLQDLALKTGGTYHKALEIDPNLDAKLRGQKEVRYLLSYQSLMKREIRGQYIDVRVAARFRQMRGLDLSGYFLP